MKTITSAFQKIVKESENHQLSGILIRGNDDAGFEHVFNRTSLSKISINVENNRQLGNF